MFYLLGLNSINNSKCYSVLFGFKSDHVTTNCIILNIDIQIVCIFALTCSLLKHNHDNEQSLTHFNKQITANLNL